MRAPDGIGHERLESSARRRSSVSSRTVAQPVSRMQRAMHGDDAVAGDRSLERQTGEKVEIVRARLRARPGDGARGGAREFARRDPAADGEIVIAGDTHAVGAADHRDAGGGVAIVADDIAEADDAVDRAFGNIVKRRLQRLEIGVDVGNLAF